MRLQRNRLFSVATASALGSVTLAAAVLPASAAPAADPTGVWLNDTGRGAIEIKNCNTGLCGHVVWVKAGVDSLGCGKQIIGEVQNSGGGTWDGGWIYNPDKKKRYDVELEPLSNGTLRVMGFAGVRFLSRTMIWKPAPQDLVRCDASAAKAAPAPAPVAKAASAAAIPAPVQTAKAPVIEPEKSVAAEATPQPEENAAANEPAGQDDGEKVTSMNLDDGIEVGDVFSMKKTGSGKCKIKAPFVDITVDCDRNN